MSKFLALFHNEMIKISRKVSIIILFVLMILGVIGVAALAKYDEYRISSNMSYANQSFYKDSIIETNKENLKYAEEELKKIQTTLANANEFEKPQLEIQEYTVKLNIESINFSIEKNIFSNDYNDFRVQAITSINSQKLKLFSLKKNPAPTESEKTEIAFLEKIIPDYNKAIEDSDYKAFVKAEKELVLNNKELTEDEKKLENEIWDLRLKLNPTGIYDNVNKQTQVESSINRIQNIKKSLLYNFDYTKNNGMNPKQLTPETRQEVENSLVVELYKIDHNLNNNSLKNIGALDGFSGMAGFGMFFVVLLMMILAGGSVSSEISTGSIKSLIISPAKRYKILFAKYISLLSVGLLAGIVLYIVSIITYGIFWGFSSGLPYVYAVNGIAHEINFYIYKLLYIFASLIDVLVLLTFAFMLSVITRNTAIAVGVSIAIFFASSIATTFIANFAKGLWTQFLPFTNFGIADRIFINDMSNPMTGNLQNIPISFSISYLSVLIICMFYTAYDSFTKRDI